MIWLYLWHAEYATAWTAAIILTAVITVRGVGAMLTASKSVIPTNIVALKGGPAWVGLLVITVTLAIVSSACQAEQDEVELESPNRSEPLAIFEIRHRVNPIVTVIASLLPLEGRPASGPELTESELGAVRCVGRPTNLTATSEMRPSFVLIAIESLRADVVGMSVDGSEVMPHVNLLARTGVKFSRAYANSTHSDYADPCVASSIYPLRSPAHHYYSSVDPPKPLLFDCFHDARYATGVFSSQNESWGNMDVFLTTPGLDVFFDAQRVDGVGMADSRDPGFADWVKSRRTAGKLDDRVTARYACRWIEKQAEQKKPFICALNLQSSHFPYTLPPSRTQQFQPTRLSPTASFLGYPEADIPAAQNSYWNALRYGDEQVGCILETLERCGVRNDTFVIIGMDNGEAFYENGEPTHAGLPFETTVHVPLIINNPERLVPRTETYLTQSIDVAPTLLGLAGLPVHPGFQGIDVLSKNRPPARERLVFVHCCNGRVRADAVVSDSGWKLISNQMTGVSKLYDLHDDPGESRDLVFRKRDVATVLQEIVQTWRRRQIQYYGNRAIFEAYYPPRSPQIAPSSMALLENNPRKDLPSR
ncbi:MAG: sulfatase [Gemmataceae bacterium]